MTELRSMEPSMTQHAVWQPAPFEGANSTVEMCHLRFTSTHGYLNPFDEACGSNNRSLGALFKYYLVRCPLTRGLILDQSQIDRQHNDHFNYTLLRSVGTAPTQGALVLLHGLNEKSWKKYWPWAVRLAELTGRTVVLFPLAYHMNRAPANWADPRSMRGVVKERQQLFPHLSNLSFANVALSQRLQFAPELFVKSGQQSLADLQTLLRQIRQGLHPWLVADAPVDFFAYSIGATLAEAALMDDREKLFQESRAVLFCGGTTLDRANPVSKAILDSEAALSLKQFFQSPIEACRALSAEQKQSLGALLMKKKTEPDWKKLHGRTLVLGLESDTVFSGDALRETFSEEAVDMEIFDTPYAAKHENPFAMDQKSPGNGGSLFTKIMQSAADFIAR